MPGPDLTSGSDPLSGTLSEAEARISALEKTGGFAPGMIGWTVGTVAPPGWLIADGSTFDVDRYAALASVLGGGTLPDLRERFALGAGAAYALLTTGGASAVTLTAAQSGSPAHTHPGGGQTGTESATHTHTQATGTAVVTTGAGASGFGAGALTIASSLGTSTESATHTHTDPNTGSSSAVAASQAHENLPPYIALTPLIHI